MSGSPDFCAVWTDGQTDGLTEERTYGPFGPGIQKENLTKKV